MTDERCHDICPVDGKARYISREQALTSAAKQGRRPRDGTARAYRCGEFWHLTRWPLAAYGPPGRGSRSIVADDGGAKAKLLALKAALQREAATPDEPYDDEGGSRSTT